MSCGDADDCTAELCSSSGSTCVQVAHPACTVDAGITEDAGSAIDATAVDSMQADVGVADATRIDANVGADAATGGDTAASGEAGLLPEAGPDLDAAHPRDVEGVDTELFDAADADTSAADDSRLDAGHVDAVAVDLPQADVVASRADARSDGDPTVGQGCVCAAPGPDGANALPWLIAGLAMACRRRTKWVPASFRRFGK